MTLGFFDGLDGMWLLMGDVLGKPIKQDIFVERSLDGRFLRIHFLPSTVTPIGDEPYSAMAIIGADGDDLVMSLFDSFTEGAGPVGRGRTNGEAVTFTFPYADGPFQTTFRRTPEGWDIEQVGASGPFASKTMRRPRLRKAWAYIVDGTRLLLLRHTDQPMAWSGLQVISGTLEDGEEPLGAVLREACEETGREDLTVIAPLGEGRYAWGHSDSDIFAFRLAFTGAVPERFEHGEFTNPGAEHRFSFFWADIRDAHLLMDHEQAGFLPELKRVLGLEVQ